MDKRLESVKFGINNAYGYSVNSSRAWKINKPFNGFEDAIIHLLNSRTAYSSTRYTSILLVDKNEILKVGVIDSEEFTINVNDMHDITWQQVIDGNYMFYDPMGDSILINLDKDAVIFGLDDVSMEELQKKTLLPIRLQFDNKYIRLSNDNLDVYMIARGSYTKLSDEASKEIIALFNKQNDRLNSDGDDV